jgi:hypothetical protein
VAAGLVLNQNQIRGSVDVTAWFCKCSFQWFKLMTSRNQLLALSRTNLVEYNTAIECLKKFMTLIQNLSFGTKSLKPFQKGILISTKSCIEHHEFLFEKGFKFVLMSRFTQDCVENLFSQVRASTPKPSCLQFKQTLRLFAVSNYICKIESSNYFQDETDNSFSFIEYLQDKKIETNDKNDNEMDVFKNFKFKTIKLSDVEKNCIYYSSGYILRKIKRIKSFGSCKSCMQHFQCCPSLRKSKFSKLIILKNYKSNKNSLFLPSQLAFNYFLIMENVIRNMKLQNFLFEKKCLQFFKLYMNKFKCPFSKCHNIQNKVTTLYFTHRIKIALKPKNRSKANNEKHLY